MRNFCPGHLRLDSIWEASWPFTTGRTLGLGFLGFVSAPRQHYSTIIVCLITLVTGRFKIGFKT